MGCGKSKDPKVTTGQKGPVNVQSGGPTRMSVTPNANAWDHPAPMKSPYPQGKPDEVLSHLKDPDWIAADDVNIQYEIVPGQMQGKVVKESYAIQQGYTYQKIK